MENTTERRQQILEFLSIQRHTTLSELMTRFDISLSTARRDIMILSCSYPIAAVRGNGGGIYIAGNFRLGNLYLTKEQYDLLERLMLLLEGNNLLVMQDILRTFTRPTV